MSNEAEELSFKDCVENDIKAAFININEFADKHILDDVEVTCIVQDVNISEELTVDKGGDYFPDLYGEAKAINIPKEDLDDVPVYGQVIMLDGERYEVVSVADDMGILTIVAIGNRR